MSIIVTDSGFQADDWQAGFVPLLNPVSGAETDGAIPAGIDLSSDTDPDLLGEVLAAPMIRIDFPSFADGRGFTLARLLRLQGYAGRLRARGHVIADQYAMARRAGFDEVEISAELAARQPEADWRFRSDWRAHDYQSHLRGTVAV